MSGRTWPQLYPSDGAIDGSPIREDPERVARSAELATATATVVNELTTMLRGLDRLDDVRFAGQTATAMVGTINEVRNSLEDVGPVFERLAGHLRTHAGALEQHRASARQALARARTAWTDRQDAQAQLESATQHLAETRSRREQLQAHVTAWTRQLEATPPDDAGVFVIQDRLRSAESELWQQRAREQTAGAEFGTAERVVARAEAELEYWRIGPDNLSAWHSLRAAEDRLDRSTAAAIAAIDLLGLADPGRLARAFSQFQDAVAWLADGGRELLTAVFSGDFIVFLKELERLLDVFASALLVVMAGVAVVAFAALLLGNPLVAIGALVVLKSLLAIGKGISAAKTTLTTTRLVVASTIGDEEARKEAAVDLLISGLAKRAGSDLAKGLPLDTEFAELSGEFVDRGMSWYGKRHMPAVIDDLDQRPVTPSGVRSLPPGDVDQRLRCRDLERLEPSEFGTVTPRLCAVA